MKSEGSPLTQKAISYTWRQLAQRVGILISKGSMNGFDEIGIPVFYGAPEQAQLQSPGLIVSRCDDSAWETILHAPENSLNWIPAKETVPAGTHLPFGNSIPVLFWGKGYEDGSKPFAERRADGSVIFHVDILAASFFMLSRWEETTLVNYDEHGRFPLAASVAYRQGFLDIPVVDQYAVILRKWVQIFFPEKELHPSKFQVKLSHDIDHIRMYSSWKSLTGYIKRHLYKDRSIVRAIRAVASRVSFRFDPYFAAVPSLAELSMSHGFKSAFYFMTSSLGQRDDGYWERDPFGKEIVKMVGALGHEVGFHPGYETFDNLKLFLVEKEKLVNVLGETSLGGRQHYLRFRVPATWRIWEQAGMQYDSSLGFAEREGFRCGTCHAYHPFDLEQNREVDLLEIPLIVMDVTLVSYRRLSPEQGQQSILHLARRCAEVGGTLTLLWHNTMWDRTRSTIDEKQSWAGIYVKVLEALRLMQESQRSLHGDKSL